MPIGDILSYNEDAFKQKINTDYARYVAITKMKSFKNQMDEFELISLFEKFLSLKIEVKNGYLNSYSYKKEGKVQVLSFESIKIKLLEHLNPS
jgi:hypothetical protein